MQLIINYNFGFTQPNPTPGLAHTNPTDWLIEILSPGQSPLLVVNKISSGIRNGSQLGWLISPAQEIVMVFVGDALPETKQGTDSLPVLDVLQEWQVSAQDIFNLLNFGI